jgi:hypothetical protein
LRDPDRGAVGFDDAAGRSSHFADVDQLKVPPRRTGLRPPMQGLHRPWQAPFVSSHRPGPSDAHSAFASLRRLVP